MNIQSINFKFFNPINNRNTVTNPQKGIKYQNLQPLANDTVNFTSKAKLAEKAKDISKTKVLEYWNPNAKKFEEIVKLAEKFERPLSKFEWDLRRAMKNLIVSETNQDNIILPAKRGIKARVKKPKSIAVKANSRELFTIDKITKMGDVGGARIVMRTKNADQIFTQLQDIVNQGYKITEIENYRPSPKNSYVSQKILDKFEQYCRKREQYPVVTNRSLPNNYTAIHVSIELPDGKVIELQIMDRDVEAVKDVEDFYYKHRCKKKFDEKYKPIQKVFDKFMSTLDDFQKETLTRYIKDSYNHARNIPERSSKIKFNPDKEFLPFPYSLPQELSFVNIFKMMEDC